MMSPPKYLMGGAPAFLDDLILSHAPRDQMVARLAALSVRPTTECLYFGCIERPGHHLWAKEGDHMVETWRREPEVCHRLGGLDGALCWNGRKESGRDETEGRAFLTHRGGWTALAFWDRSVDRRGACNSVFLAPGVLTFEQLVRLARHHWPKVWERFTFPVVEVDERGNPKDLHPSMSSEVERLAFESLDATAVTPSSELRSVSAAAHEAAAASFGRYMRDVRLKANVSLRDLAKALGVSHVFLSEVERGFRGLARQHWPRLLEMLPELDPLRLEHMDKLRLPLRINVADKPAPLQDVCILFAERVEAGKLTAEQISAMRAILSKEGSE